MNRLVLPQPALSRRGFLAGAVALAAGAKASPAAPAATAAPAPPHRFVSRPDLRPPVVSVATSSGAAAPGLVFLAPFQITGKAGPGYHLGQITPERMMAESYSYDGAALKSLRELGFTSGNIVPDKGVVRGVSALVLFDDEGRTVGG